MKNVGRSQSENVQVVANPSASMQGSKNNINHGTGKEMTETLLTLTWFAYHGGECSCRGRDGAVWPLCAQCCIPLSAHLGVELQLPFKPFESCLWELPLLNN